MFTVPTNFAAAAAEQAVEHESGILGINLESFIIQIITFVLVFVILKKFAFDRIVTILDKRYKVIDEGVRHGQQMQKEREKLEKETEKIVREARLGADEIIGHAQKDAREIVRDAEKAAHKKSEVMLKDAEARISEEAQQSRRKLEKEIVGLVSEATEAVVHEKVDAKKDAELIDKAIKGRKK